MIAKVLKALAEHDTFVLTSHARPDGDAVGSLLALYLLLGQLGKRADVVLCDGVPLIYRSLPFSNVVRQTAEVAGDFQAAVILECEGLGRTRIRGFEDKFLVNIDHHASGRPFAHVNWIEPKACAVAEQIFQLAKAAGTTITAEMATCLYTAVLADTGAFCYEGTNECTFLLAQELVHLGAQPVSIGQNVFFSNSASKMKLLGFALNNLHCEGRLAWMYANAEEIRRSGAREEDMEGLVNYALAIVGIEAAAFVREMPDSRSRVSLRSKGSLDVAKIAESLGGGGHRCASGCSIDLAVPEAVDLILERLRSALDSDEGAVSVRRTGIQV